MTKESTVTREFKDIRRENIMEKALRAFSKKGYKRVTTDDIAREAGCSHGLFYRYFPNKEAVFSAIQKEVEKDKWKKYVFNWEEIKKQGGYDGLLLFSETACRIIKGPEPVVEYWEAVALENFSPSSFPSNKRVRDFKPNILALIDQGQKEGKVRMCDGATIGQMMLDLMEGALKRRLSNHSSHFVIYCKDDFATIFEKR